MQEHNFNPAEIDDVDQLLGEGESRVKASLMMYSCLGPTSPPPEAYYERAFRLGVSDPIKEHDARYTLGIFLATCHRREDALPHIRRAVELNPNDYRTRFVMGKLYEDSGRFEGASNEFFAASSMASPFTMQKYKALLKAVSNYLKS